MSFIWRHPKSQYWIARFYDRIGKRRGTWKISVMATSCRLWAIPFGMQFLRQSDSDAGKCWRDLRRRGSDARKHARAAHEPQRQELKGAQASGVTHEKIS